MDFSTWLEGSGAGVFEMIENKLNRILISAQYEFNLCLGSEPFGLPLRRGLMWATQGHRANKPTKSAKLRGTWTCLSISTLTLPTRATTTNTLIGGRFSSNTLTVTSSCV
jgi:hypothetical protein